MTPTTTPPSSKNGVAASNDPNKGSSSKNGVAAVNHPNDNKGSITLELPADSAGEAMRSEVHDIGGFSWQILPPKPSNPEAFTIACNEHCKDRLWYCKANYSVAVQDTKGGPVKWLAQNLKRNWFNTFNFQYVQYREQKGEPTPKWIRVSIEIQWSTNEQSFPKVDSTLKMIYGDKFELLPINKYHLAAHSTYFRKIFFGDGNERKKSTSVVMVEQQDGNKVNLPVHEIQVSQEKTDGVQFDHIQFRFMIYAQLCMGHTLGKLVFMSWAVEDREKKVTLLKLANKYRLPAMVDLAEKLLIKLGQGTMELLLLADQQKSDVLKKHCMDTIDPIEYCKGFVKNNELLAQISPETRNQLEASLNATAERYSRKRKYLQGDD